MNDLTAIPPGGKHESAAFGFEELEIRCSDDAVISGHFRDVPNPERGVVIINPATGVKASFYHRFARFLSDGGHPVLTYDYRGIGASRTVDPERCSVRWSDWGTLDFAGALEFAKARVPHLPILVIGHSIGGFLPGMAPNAASVSRMLTVGAQYGWWGAYDVRQRMRLLVKWHLAMPVLTALFGYFPGRRLGWIEDLPAGVAYEWAFKRRCAEKNVGRDLRRDFRARFARFHAPITAVTITDDPIGTKEAVMLGLSYYTSSRTKLLEIDPIEMGLGELGHFGLFHSSNRRLWPKMMDALNGEGGPS